MRKPVAVCFADSHLQERAWAGRPIEGDSYHSFEQIINYAAGHGIDTIIGAGDLIDRQQNRSAPIVQLGECLQRIANHGCTLLYIQGQHELEQRPWLAGFPATGHIHRFPVDVGPFRLYGIDYQSAATLQEELSNIPPDIDILIAHQTWTDFMGEKAATQGLLSDIPTVSQCFTGDFHQCVQVDIRGASGQALHVISPGSTCMQSIDEPPEKYFFVLHDDGSWEAIQLETRRVIESPLLGNLGAVDNFLDELPSRIEVETADVSEVIRKPLLWVKYTHEMAEAVRTRVPKLVGEKAFLFWKEKPPEAVEAVERRRETVARGEAKASTLESELHTYLQDHQQADLEEDIRRLLGSPDPAETLRQLREAALK